MKSFLSSFADPYIHVILLALILTYLLMEGKGGRENDPEMKQPCRICAGDVIYEQECRHQATNDPTDPR